MITIHTPHITDGLQGEARFSALVSAGDFDITLWFSLPASQKGFFTEGVCDPFVFALLPYAVAHRQDIVCEGSMSPRLHMQARIELIPALSPRDEIAHPIRILCDDMRVPEYREPPSAVGTPYAADTDHLYTVYSHVSEPYYPLTHLAMFNCGGFDTHADFEKACSECLRVSKELKLHALFVDTNLSELPEEYRAVRTFRSLSCVLAMQNLFSVWLLPTPCNAKSYSLDFSDSVNYDILTAGSASTETLTVYPSGSETDEEHKKSFLAETEHERTD